MVVDNSFIINLAIHHFDILHNDDDPPIDDDLPNSNILRVVLLERLVL